MPLETEPSPVVASTRAPRAHACFRLDTAAPLDVSAERELHELWTRLSYRVIRDPGNLLAHSRRVLLCRRQALRERLPAALLDLDHATEGRGRALRQRLLGTVRPCLRAEHAAWFEARLDGSSPPGGEPDGPGRVLPSMNVARRALDDGPTDRA